MREDDRAQAARAARRNQQTFADKPCRCCGASGWRAYRGSGIGFSNQGWRWVCRTCYYAGCGVLSIKCSKEGS